MDGNGRNKTCKLVVNNLRHPELGRRTGKNVIGDKIIRKDHRGRECFADYFTDVSEDSALDSSDASQSFVKVPRSSCKSITLSAVAFPDDSVYEPRPMSPFSPLAESKSNRRSETTVCLINPVTKYGDVPPTSSLLTPLSEKLKQNTPTELQLRGKVPKACLQTTYHSLSATNSGGCAAPSSELDNSSLRSTNPKSAQKSTAEQETQKKNSKSRHSFEIFEDSNLPNLAENGAVNIVYAVSMEHESMLPKRKKELPNLHHSQDKAKPSTPSVCKRKCVAEDSKVKDVMLEMDAFAATSKNNFEASKHSQSRKSGSIKVAVDSPDDEIDNASLRRTTYNKISVSTQNVSTPISDGKKQRLGSQTISPVRLRNNLSDWSNTNSGNLGSCIQVENMPNTESPNSSGSKEAFFKERSPISTSIGENIIQGGRDSDTSKIKMAVHQSVADCRAPRTSNCGSPITRSSNMRNSEVLKSLMKSYKRRQLTKIPQIYVPRNDENISVRRSSRQRVVPLEYWRNERLKYKRQSTGYVIDGVIEPTVSAAHVKPKKKKLEQHRANKCRVTKYPHEMVEVPAQPIPVYNPEVLGEVYVDCFGLQSAKSYYGADGNEENDSHTFIMCKTLQQRAFHAGEIILHPGACKPLQNTMLDTLVFKVDEGQLVVRIHETSSFVVPGDFFFVPSGNLYSLTNTNKVEAKLTFFQIRGTND